MGRHSQAALRGILGKNKDQLSQIVSEKFQLDIITGKNCFLLQGISINFIYLPIHCRFWDQERLKKTNNRLEKSYFPSYTSSSLQPPQCPHPSSFAEAVASAGDRDQCTWGLFLHWQQLLQAAPCSSCSGKTLDPTPAQVSSSLFPPPAPLWTSFLLLLPPWPCFSFCLVYATVDLRHFKTQRCHRFP